MNMRVVVVGLHGSLDVLCRATPIKDKDGTIGINQRLMENERDKCIGVLFTTPTGTPDRRPCWIPLAGSRSKLWGFDTPWTKYFLSECSKPSQYLYSDYQYKVQFKKKSFISWSSLTCNSRDTNIVVNADQKRQVARNRFYSPFQYLYLKEPGRKRGGGSPGRKTTDGWNINRSS